MGFQYRTLLLFSSFILIICEFNLKAQKLESIDLEYLYSDWAFSYNESSKDTFILRRSTDEILSIEERKDWYNFKKQNDTVLFNQKIKIKRFFCAVGYDYNKEHVELNKLGGLYDLWTFDPIELTLTHLLTYYDGKEEYNHIFTSVYKILALKEDFVKLQLQKELFEGIE